MAARGHRDVIEDEAHRPRAAGVVAGRADGAKRAFEFLLENQVDRQDRRAGGAQRRIQAVRVHRRVRIEVHGAAVRRDLADRFHIIQRMHARERFVGGERRLEFREI